MKYLKPHFWYHKRQRNGVLFLVFIIILLFLIQGVADFYSNNEIKILPAEKLALQQQIDSLKKLEIERRKPKIYPFNPNYISDQKGERLGMSIQEIDRLHHYRKQQKFINSATEFQYVTKVSDSLLAEISPYFKFPDWVIQRNKRLQNKKQAIKKHQDTDAVLNTHTVATSTTNINLATTQDFETIQGVDEILAARIVAYRKKLQGYSFSKQLYEVWYLDKVVADRILTKFSIHHPPKIKKVNVNTATFKELLSNPYIDAMLCKKILEFRNEVAELQSISELKNIKDFPLEKYRRIVLYLEAK